MDEYLCLHLRSNPGEREADFKARLTAFWTHMLRQRPDDYEKVYAEATAFETSGDTITRQYLIEASVAIALAKELTHAAMAFDPIDEDDHYSKYEAAPPDWFWIEH